MRLYFDHNATTPLAPEVLEAMSPFLRGEYGNASSIHSFGQRARAAVERARSQVATLIHCKADEIVFTSGGTEADNIAVLGAVRANARARKHVITSTIEHHAVLHVSKALELEGVDVTYLPVDREGRVDADAVRRALRPETLLVSVMHANNETGTIQPVEEIAAIAHEAAVLFHTDAVQSVAKVPVDVGRIGADLLTLSAHKFCGPKGAGALFVREGTQLQPIMFGGVNKSDPRPGTENVAAIVGLGAAAQLAMSAMHADMARVRDLRDRLETGILSSIEHAGVNGPASRGDGSENVRVPNTTNIYFDFIEGEALVISLDLMGIACSTGAACSSGAVEPSHVLLALGLPVERARASLRLSLGKQTTSEDVEMLLQALPQAVDRLRKLSPRSAQATTALH